MAAKPSYEELINKVRELQKTPHEIIGYSLTDVFGRQNWTVEEASGEKI